MKEYVCIRDCTVMVPHPTEKRMYPRLFRSDPPDHLILDDDAPIPGSRRHGEFRPYFKEHTTRTASEIEMIAKLVEEVTVLRNTVNALQAVPTVPHKDDEWKEPAKEQEPDKEEPKVVADSSAIDPVDLLKVLDRKELCGRLTDAKVSFFRGASDLDIAKKYIESGLPVPAVTSGTE